MRYLSLFSGIEAATVAWQPLGCASPNDLVPETAERSGTYRRRLHAASGPGSGSPGQDANSSMARRSAGCPDCSTATAPVVAGAGRPSRKHWANDSTAARDAMETHPACGSIGWNAMGTVSDLTGARQSAANRRGTRQVKCHNTRTRRWRTT